MTWKTLRSWLNQSTACPNDATWRRHGAVRLNLETLETRITPSFTVGPNFNISKSSIEDAETSICVTPANRMNLFATATASGSNYYSLDGGATWQVTALFSGSANGVTYSGGTGGDQQEAWDNFGNLFLVYFAIDNNTNLHT